MKGPVPEEEAVDTASDAVQAGQLKQLRVHLAIDQLGSAVLDFQGLVGRIGGRKAIESTEMRNRTGELTAYLFPSLLTVLLGTSKRQLGQYQHTISSTVQRRHLMSWQSSHHMRWSNG